jgi:hypothetical protein
VGSVGINLDLLVIHVQMRHFIPRGQKGEIGERKGIPVRPDRSIHF